MKHTLEEVTLGNGVKGLLVDVPGTEVLRFQVRFNSGYAFSSAAKYEMPHITEHLLVGGNEDYPDSIAFKAEIEKNGAYFNAHTSDLFNWYDWECPAFEAQRILSLATSQLGKPLIQATDVSTEKGRVEQELKSNMSDHYQTIYDMIHKHFEGSQTYKTRIEQLGAITADDMREYYERTHTKENARFFAAGAVRGNKQAILQGFENLTNKLPTGDVLEFPITTRKPLERPLIKRRAISQVFYVNNFVHFATSAKQRAALSLLTTYLGSYLPSSLFGAVWQSGLAYGVSTFFEYGPDNSELFIANNVSPGNIEPLFRLIVKQLRHVLDGKLSAGELRATKQMVNGEEKVRYQTPSNLAGYYITDYMLFNDKTTIEGWRKLKDSITLKDIRLTLEQMLQQGLWTQGFVGPIKQEQADKLYKEMAKLRR